MVERKASVESIGFGNELVGELVIQNPLSYGQYLYDICAFVIKCPHNSIPVRRIKDKSALWLPYVSSSSGQKWQYCVQSLAEQFINDQIQKQDDRLSAAAKASFISSVVLASVSRLQLPQKEFIRRVIFFAKWKSTDKIVCCYNTDQFEWLSLRDLKTKAIDKLWGSEVEQMAELLLKTDGELQKESLLFNEYTIEDVSKHLQKDDNNENPKIDNNLWKNMSQFLKKSSIDEKVLEKLYSDFIQHCYPSLNMSYTSFRQYITKLDLKSMDEKRLEKCFKAFDFNHKRYLGFTEILLGITALDPQSLHGQTRAQFVFRFYDTNCDGFVDENDLKEMITDLRKIDSKSSDSQSIDEVVQQILKIDNICDNNHKISLKSFLSSLKSPLMAFTSHLFRSIESIHKLISNKNIYETIGRHSRRLTEEQQNVNFCPKCRNKNYKLSVHSIRMSHSGRLTNPKSILSTDGKDVKFSVEDEFTETQRNHSIDMTNKMNSLPNRVLDVIRDLVKGLVKSNATEQSKQEICSQTTSNLNQSIVKEICEEMIEIFSCEPRVLKVQSPVYVLGDIHGNIEDLIIFEEQLWRMAPTCMPTSILFTGNYVDGGKYGIECVLYLYCLKILNPTQVFLLRGNHEIRSVQKVCTFEKECIEKHKSKGQTVFELINQTFDVLPIVAIVDESIYCTHGGIPSSIKTIAELIQIPIQLKEPEVESPAVWEILWSDPMEVSEFDQLVKYKNMSETTQFLPNDKRQTGNYFSQKAVNEFLSANNLSRIIRGNQMKDNGFDFHLDAKVITIFSSSRYNNTNNKAAVVRIDGHNNQGFIKIISLET